MQKYFLLFAFLVPCLFFSQSKSFHISGAIIAQDDKNPLESATVYLEQAIDSTLVTYDISDSDGKFSLEGKTSHKQLNLYISYVGFKKHYQSIEINDTSIDLQNIFLETDQNVLDAVVVRSTAPVTVKKDTLEFNVNSFKTKRDANVEDFLKELPGVEVGDDGKLMINGKDIDKILVNGKPFFAGDPTITTRNLTKDLIKKIQITDTKTKAEAFAGEAGEQTNKTLNLVIDKEKNKGVFGRLAAGTGTDSHYEYAGMFNYFNNDRRLSVLSGGNDVNSPGFSFGEIKKMFGGGNGVSIRNGSFGSGGQSFGAGRGITESKNIGVNYADDYGELVELSSNYFYSGSNSGDKSSIKRENILSDGTRYFTNSEVCSFNNSNNHSSNFDFDIKVDSTFYISIEPSYKYSKNEQTSERNETSRNNGNVLTNQSSSLSFLENSNQSFRNRLSIIKRIGASGSFFKFYVYNEMNTSETDNSLNSETNFFGDAEIPDDIIRNQIIGTDDETNNMTISTAYRLPLKAKEFFLDFKYNFSKSKRELTKNSYDFDDTTQGYSDFNIDLSKDYEQISESSTPSLRLRYKRENWSTSFETKYIFRDLENNDFLRPNFSLRKKFEALELRYRFKYRFTAKSSLGLGYEINNDAPQISRLQDFRDETDPLNVVIGNPDLKPSINHRFYTRYKTFNFQKGTEFYAYFRASFDEDESISKRTIDENLVRETTYTNVNGNFNINGRVSLNKQIKIDSVKTVKFYLSLRPSIQKAINFNNGDKYASTVKSIEPRFGVRLRWRDVLEFSPMYSISFSKNTYDIDRFEDQDFLFHSLNLKSAMYMPKDFEWRNDVSFSYNPNIATGFQKSAWFWNSTLAYSLLKDQGTMTLKVYDLLNQNTNARRIATQNYIQDSQSTVLQQYFMLSFSWKFNSLGKQV